MLEIGYFSFFLSFFISHHQHNTRATAHPRTQRKRAAGQPLRGTGLLRLLLQLQFDCLGI